MALVLIVAPKPSDDFEVVTRNHMELARPLTG